MCRSSETALDEMAALKARKSSADQVGQVGFSRNKAPWSGNQQHQQGKKGIYLKFVGPVSVNINMGEMSVLPGERNVINVDS